MMQVVGVVIALFSVRWLGRRGGLIISEITMCVSVSLLAVYVLWDQQETTDLLTDLTTMSPDNSTLQSVINMPVFCPMPSFVKLLLINNEQLEPNKL